MNYKAAMFDLDGTLLDTLEDLANSMNKALQRMGFPTHPKDEYRYFVGDGMINLAIRVLPENEQTPDNIETLCQFMTEEYSARWNESTTLYPGISSMLDSLVEEGILLTVLSNKPDEFTKMVVRKLLPDWDFAIVRGACEGVSKKPDPAGAIHIMNELGVGPEGFIYLGDTNTDMKTATAAGIFPVGAVWGFRTAAELLESGAKVLLKNPEELINLIK